MAGNTKRKFKANWQIDSIDGKVVKADEIVELDPEAAKPLLQLRALSPVNSPAPEPEPKGDGKAGGHQPAK